MISPNPFLLSTANAGHSDPILFPPRFRSKDESNSTRYPTHELPEVELNERKGREEDGGILNERFSIFGVYLKVLPAIFPFAKGEMVSNPLV